MTSLRFHRPCHPSWLGCACLLVALGAQAEPGVTASVVRVGVMVPLSNMQAEVGTAYFRGARASAEEINRQGGVGGRKIQLLPLDTLPVAAEAVTQAREVLQSAQADDQVFALMGTLGQPSVEALTPLLNKLGVPLLGPATGIGAYLQDPGGWIFPVRRSDDKVLRSLVSQMGAMSVTQLAVVHPRTPDALRQLQTIKDALKDSKVVLVTQTDVGDTNVEVVAPVAAVIKGRPDVILSLGSYEVTDAVFRQLRAVGYKGLFVAHSDVGTRRLRELLKEQSRGVGIASGLPSLYATIPAAREFRTAMQTLGGTASSALDEPAFEGYLAVRILAEGLRRVGASPTRAALRRELVSQPLEFSGLLFDYRRSVDRGLQTPGSMYVMTGDGRVSQ